MCKNYSFKVNVQVKKSNFSFPSPPPPIITHRGREKGKEKLDFAARTLSLNKQYLHSSHQIYVKNYYFGFNGQTYIIIRIAIKICYLTNYTKKLFSLKAF